MLAGEARGPVQDRSGLLPLAQPGQRAAVGRARRGQGGDPWLPLRDGWAPSRTTLNVPARRGSTALPLTDPAGSDLPTCASYRRRSRRESGDSTATRAVAGLS